MFGKDTYIIFGPKTPPGPNLLAPRSAASAIVSTAGPAPIFRIKLIKPICLE